MLPTGLRSDSGDGGITKETKTKLLSASAGGQGIDLWLFQFIRHDPEFQGVLFRTAEDGYEQVLGFVGRGEVLGFDAVWMGRHPMAAAALEPSRVYAMPSKNIFTLGQYVPALDRVLHLAVSRELTRRGEIADLMAAVSAEVRLARFLVHLSERMQASGQSPKHLLLSMCRRDIASHLGVAHETVSRSFSALADWNCLRVSNREVEILDMARLKALSRSTRGSTDDMPGRTQTNHRNARG